MPNTLETVEFSDQLLHLVQGFNCGDDPWAVAASEWISGPCSATYSALQSIADRGNSVWLYYDGPNLIGFGSLGESEWPDMPPSGNREYFSYIPQLAIASNFQSCPKNCPAEQRYSHQIMSDLIGRALLASHEVLGLHVHEQNLPAIRLYQAFDFHVLPPCKKPGQLRMIRLLR
jgi:ribosomal protein S18 acetylase RimI-like enzyme